MNVLVATVAGSFAVDLETDEVEPWDGAVSPPPAPTVNLPRVVAAAAAGSTVAVVVDAKPPILISHDTGGLPPGRAIAISDDDPDLLVYAGRNLLYVSRNGGVFWSALALELPEIERIAL
jgi:hypothetical protein